MVLRINEDQRAIRDMAPGSVARGFARQTFISTEEGAGGRLIQPGQGCTVLNELASSEARSLVFVSDRELLQVIGRTPLDHYIIWSGRPRTGRASSVLSLALVCIDEVWSPVSLRAFLQRAARLEEGYGLAPEAVKKAIWSHQSAAPACYYLVRKTSAGDYVAVTDVPRPSSLNRPIRAGEIVFSRNVRLEA